MVAGDSQDLLTNHCMGRFGSAKKRILIVGACDSKGGIYLPSGMEPSALLECKKKHGTVCDYEADGAQRFEQPQTMITSIPDFDVLLDAVWGRHVPCAVGNASSLPVPPIHQANSFMLHALSLQKSIAAQHVRTRARSHRRHPHRLCKP